MRVTLTNFVTYTKAEFLPGPNLNMIIGPNGTGKSTLVCAICLGLGWYTSHLGRAKDLGEFVKHGAKKAEIEIELAADPARQQTNPVITNKIARDGNKAEYLIDGKKSNKKAVQTLARSFSIQVDNLCQFLPQDRVVEFAALSPVDLLTQTQRAAAPEYMTEWHDSLKDMRRKQKTEQEVQQKTMESLKNDENRQRLQEADVERLREHTELQERIAALEKLRPFPEYQVAKQRHRDAKDRRKEAQRELNALQRKMEPNLRAVTDKQQYLERTEKVVHRRRALVERSEGTVADIKKKISAVEEKIEDCTRGIEVERKKIKETKQSVPRFQQEINRLQKAMQSPPPAFDSAEMNEKIREKTRQIRDLEPRLREVQEQVATLNEQGRQRNQIIQNANTERESLQSQAGQQANKLKRASPDAAKAWEWIQQHRDNFQGEVFGPPVIECTVKDPRHADAVESCIPDGDKLAFTVTCHEDFKLLTRQLYTEMRLNEINIRTAQAPLASFTAPMSQEQLERYGLQSYILDLLDGPSPVLAMLCDNRSIHQTGYTSRDLSEEQFSALQRSQLSSWVTSTQSYMVSRRREYGDQATSTRVTAVKKARFFTDVPVDRQQEQAIDSRIREAASEIEEIKKQRTELMAQGQQLNEDRKQLNAEKKEIEEEKNVKQRAFSEFQGLPVKEAAAQKKLQDAQAKIKDTHLRQRAIVDRGDNLHLDKGQLVLDYAHAIEALRGLHIQLFEVEILQIEAKSDLEQIKAQHAEEERLIEARTQELAELQHISDRLFQEGQRLGDKCKVLGESFSEVEGAVYEEIAQWTPEQMETEIESKRARLEMTAGNGNQNLIKEYEQRARRIDDKRAQLNQLDESLSELEDQIKDVRDRWEPELDGLIAQISEAFAENFARIQCAGDVDVYKDEDFEQWAIQIKVKFR